MRCGLELMFERMWDPVSRIRGPVAYEAFNMVLSPGNIKGKHCDVLGFQ